MTLTELAEKSRELMLDTGQGHKPVVFLDSEGATWSIDDLVFDHENNVFLARADYVKQL